MHAFPLCVQGDWGRMLCMHLSAWREAHSRYVAVDAVLPGGYESAEEVSYSRYEMIYVHKCAAQPRMIWLRGAGRSGNASRLLTAGEPGVPELQTNVPQPFGVRLAAPAKTMPPAFWA